MTSDDIEKYMHRKSSIDCARMVLRQNAAQSDHVYEGPGSIYQTNDGSLMFKLYASAPSDSRWVFERIFGLSSIKSGEIIPRTEYFSLEAASLQGDIWRGDFILPELSQGVDGGSVLSGSLYELTNEISESEEKQSKVRPSLSLRFADSFDFPANTKKTTKTFVQDVETSFGGDWTSVAVFEAAGIGFQLHKDPTGVFLSARSKDMLAFPPYLDTRVCEALEFTLFEPMRWVIRTAFGDGQTVTTLRPFPRERTKSTPRPPIAFNSHKIDQDVWNLFAKYIQHIITHQKPEPHPLWNSLHFAVLADERPLDAGLILLSVAVEGMLKEGFPNLAAPEESLAKQVNDARRLLSGPQFSDSFKKRVTGMLESMRGSRPKDKLISLENAGVIRKELIRAWEDIRHRAIHADSVDKTAISETYHKYQSVLTLLNELAFLTVGYTGPYTDYSVPGWPPRKFEKTMKDANDEPVNLTAVTPPLKPEVLTVGEIAAGESTSQKQD